MYRYLLHIPQLSWLALHGGIRAQKCQGGAPRHWKHGCRPNGQSAGWSLVRHSTLPDVAKAIHDLFALLQMLCALYNIFLPSARWTRDEVSIRHIRSITMADRPASSYRLESMHLDDAMQTCLRIRPPALLNRSASACLAAAVSQPRGLNPHGRVLAPSWFGGRQETHGLHRRAGGWVSQDLLFSSAASCTSPPHGRPLAIGGDDDEIAGIQYISIK